MTRITARYGRDSYSILCSGHAGTTESCSAVSGLIGALAGWVHNHTGAVSMDKGEALIVFPEQEGAGAVMDLTVIGLLQIQQAAPDDVSVNVESRVPGSP